jgi:hypothetical protein
VFALLASCGRRVIAKDGGRTGGVIKCSLISLPVRKQEKYQTVARSIITTINEADRRLIEMQGGRKL